MQGLSRGGTASCLELNNNHAIRFYKRINMIVGFRSCCRSQRSASSVALDSTIVELNYVFLLAQLPAEGLAAWMKTQPAGQILQHDNHIQKSLCFSFTNLL
jgi:hypothetical protein